MFVKGVSGNPAGKKPGTKDKKWASLDYWFGLVQHEWKNLEPKDRAHIAIEAWKALLNRKIPMTPEESVKNADAAMQMLKILEEASRNATNTSASPGSYTNGMANGKVSIQTETPPASGV